MRELHEKTLLENQRERSKITFDCEEAKFKLSHT